MGKWILHHFQFTVGQFRGVCGGVGWSVGECFGINKTDFSRWLWKDADEVRVRLFRVSATYPLVWNIWIISSTSGSGEGTRSGLIDIIPINSTYLPKLSHFEPDFEPMSCTPDLNYSRLANLTSLRLQRVWSRPRDSVSARLVRFAEALAVEPTELLRPTKFWGGLEPNSSNFAESGAKA